MPQPPLVRGREDGLPKLGLTGQLGGHIGGTTMTISYYRPAGEKEAANGLPGPAGDFRPVLRMYEPDPAIHDGGYEFPSITRTD